MKSSCSPLLVYIYEGSQIDTNSQRTDRRNAGTRDMGKEADLEQSSKIPESAEGATRYHISGIGVRNWGLVVTPDQEIGMGSSQ